MQQLVENDFLSQYSDSERDEGNHMRVESNERGPQTKSFKALNGIIEFKRKNNKRVKLKIYRHIHIHES